MFHKSQLHQFHKACKGQKATRILQLNMAKTFEWLTSFPERKVFPKASLYKQARNMIYRRLLHRQPMYKNLKYFF